ncbi:MAG: imidazole glycerol phosphate synthase subunit HisH [Gammaproteobacteria bacterium]|nr:imidazole glycerol phosphate synthase subunit HisH [Gammaproteobacteria bacterium]
MIAVIDVSGNNLTSIGNALKQLGYDYEMTHCVDTIRRATHVILPGVGSADTAMRALEHYQLIDVLKTLTQPLLGICLGMQLLLEHSEEGDVACLGLMPGSCKKIQASPGFTVPHMGWNQLQWEKNNPILQNVTPGEHVYFVHSYALQRSEFTVARCQYKQEISAIVQKGQVYGMQFHPEKSADTGLQLLKNFLETSSC